MAGAGGSSGVLAGHLEGCRDTDVRVFEEALQRSPTMMCVFS